MKIKTNLVFLGFVRRVQYRDHSGELNTKNWKLSKKLLTKTDRSVAGLFVTSDAKTLYFIPWVNPRVSDAPKGFELQKKTFERWANRTASESIKIHLPPKLKKLQHIGFIEEIEYTSDKFERLGDDGKYNLYMHRYGKTKPAIFLNCPLTPYMWGVNDPKGRKLMTYRGLIL